MTLLNINMCVDIVEHLPAMKLLASECDVIVEYGVREGTSTGAWLSQKPKKLTCIDLRPDVLVESGGNYRAFAEENQIDFQVICGNSMVVEPIPCDLLFIDTHHIYEQLIQELRRHGSSARKYIVCHDTTYNAGCWDAVVEYVNNHPEWTVKAHYENNNGLAVLERINEVSQNIIERKTSMETQEAINVLIRYGHGELKGKKALAEALEAVHTLPRSHNRTIVLQSIGRKLAGGKTAVELQEQVNVALASLIGAVVLPETEAGLHQLHWQFADGSTEMRSQTDVTSSEELRKWVEETKQEHPLPEGAQWMMCNEQSEYFVVSPVAEE